MYFIIVITIDSIVVISLFSCLLALKRGVHACTILLFYVRVDSSLDRVIPSTVYRYIVCYTVDGYRQYSSTSTLPLIHASYVRRNVARMSAHVISIYISFSFLSPGQWMSRAFIKPGSSTKIQHTFFSCILDFLSFVSWNHGSLMISRKISL